MTTPKSAIQKGKLLEVYVANEIERLKLGKARRSIGSGSGTREKSDIDTDMMLMGVNVGIECKNHKVPHIKKWWEQTQALEKVGREPILVYSLGGENIENAKVVLYLDTFLRLAKRAEEPKTQANANQETMWALTTLIASAKKVLKLLE
jgi:hypothetical protein